MITITSSLQKGNDCEQQEVDISVIVVSWNSRIFLEQCLQSLANQRDEVRLETIVVDNGSTDGSRQLVSTDYPDVHLIENAENLGFSAANNIGIRRSRGRYVCLINSDVVVKPKCLSILLRYMEKQTKVGMVGPRLLNGDGSLQLSCRVLPTLRRVFIRSLALDALFPRSPFFTTLFLAPEEHLQRRKVEVLKGAFWMIRKESLQEVGLLDERFFMYSEDVDLCKRFNDSKWEIRYVSAAQATHFMAGSSRNAPIRCFLDMHRSQWLYWQKHHGGIQSQIWRWLMILHHANRLIASLIVSAVKKHKAERYIYTIERSRAVLRFLLSASAANPQENEYVRSSQ